MRLWSECLYSSPSLGISELCTRRHTAEHCFVWNGRKINSSYCHWNRNQETWLFLRLNYWHWCQDAVTVFLEKRRSAYSFQDKVTQHVCIDKVILSRKTVQRPSYSVQAGFHLSWPYAISDPIENLPTNFQEKHLGLIKSHTLILLYF